MPARKFRLISHRKTPLSIEPPYDATHQCSIMSSVNELNNFFASLPRSSAHPVPGSQVGYQIFWLRQRLLSMSFWYPFLFTICLSIFVPGATPLKTLDR